ncbi:MAG: MarR family transcriptional regulator [Spirochaetales bacterium]|nr:MarR family transcriptional regulator [Spirochaetales bacterium]
MIASDSLFDVLECLKENPGSNASFLSGKLKLHIITIQRILDTLEKYGFVRTDEKKGIGRPSKTYFYLGGQFTFNLDEMTGLYETRDKKIREKGDPNVRFSYNVDKEIVNAVLPGGKKGKALKLDEKSGKFLWCVPPPDSAGATVREIAEKSGMPVMDAIRFVLEMIDLNVIEETGKKQ